MKNERVLIVEDEKIIALDLQRRLERFGYEVCDLASESAEAMEKARRKMPDIVLMDIMLAGDVDGIQTAIAIRRELAIPVVFLTAYADEKTLERAKKAEPFGYILKPFKERELYTTIDIALYKHGIDRKLRKQEQLFSAILHSVSDGIVATDVDAAVRYMNPVAEDITGVREEDAKGRPLAEVLSLLDSRTKEPLLPGMLPREGDRPRFFKDALLRTSQGVSLIVDGTATKIYEEKNETEGYVVAVRDVTEIKRMSAQIDYQASHDSLTGLSNREEFCFKLQEVIKETRESEAGHVLLLLDVDRFKIVNDTCGSLAGDELLKQVAAYIQSLTQKHDISARFGGDEFAIILQNCSIDNSVNVARRLQDAVQNHRFVWQNSSFPVTLSIGIVPVDGASGNVHEMLAAADDACYLSKEEGGNRINIYKSSEAKYQNRRGEMEWISKINKALEQNSFRLFFQPIVPIRSAAEKAKIEILIRLLNEDGSYAPPGDFIGAAERYNLMPAIDRWVVQHTARSVRTLLDQKSPVVDGKIVCINLSGVSLLDEDLMGFIIDQFSAADLPPESFCFEITETAAIQNLSYASRFMRKLKGEGFTFSLDDFGSGFSSFGYLKNLPVDYLKIDGSFVKHIDDNLVSFTMVESINSMGHVLGLKTVAEFVCNKAILGKIAAIGVDYAQGYEISQPQPLIPD